MHIRWALFEFAGDERAGRDRWHGRRAQTNLCYLRTGVSRIDATFPLLTYA